MPNKKISELTAAGALTGAELVEVVQSGTNVKTTTQDIADLGGGGGGAVDSVNGQTGVVVLDAGDVGADPAGTAAALLTTSITNGDTTHAPNGDVVYDTFVTKLDRNLTIKTKTASHTLDSDDLTDLNLGKDILFLMNVAAGHNFTIPPNATIDVDAGGHIYVMRIGAGQTTFVGAGPPTVTGSAGSLLDPGANIIMPVFQTADNQWYVQNGSGGAYVTWNPGFTGFSANPGSVDATYVVIGKFAHVRMSASNGTSNLTTFTITGLPVAPRVGMNFISLIMNNGATATGRIDITAGTTTMTLYATAAAGAWTASGNKNAYLNFIMEVQ